MGYSRQEYWSGLPFPSPMHQGQVLFRQTYLGLFFLSAQKLLFVIYFFRGCSWGWSGPNSNSWPHFRCSAPAPRRQPLGSLLANCQACRVLDSTAPPSELLEICELSQEKMSCVFEDSNVYMLHMMYQAMGVCLYMQDWEGALRYGQKIIQPYR